eukprot:TRINITY_DN6631_c0_g1_i1.p1 TRINITY_DN6631_c0_g1~~TRINITY_DN6631_c0_g1_i1.p1  ORF type:complete len:462 (+),score=73.62 TRINITY_DN6631_c0_g1_i1:89-1474(+)
MSPGFSAILPPRHPSRGKMRKSRSCPLTSIALLLSMLLSSSGIRKMGFVSPGRGRDHVPSQLASAPSRKRGQTIRVRGHVKSQQGLPSWTASNELPAPRAEILEKQAARPRSTEMLLSWSIWVVLAVIGTAAASLALNAYSFGFNGAWSQFLAQPFGSKLLLGIPAAILFGSCLQGWEIYQWSLAGGVGIAAAKAFGARKPQPSSDGGWELHERVSALGARAGLPPGCPRVFVVPSEEPNAFAAGIAHDDSVVAVTEGLLKNANLTSDELDAVLAHEIGHIRNGDCASGIQIGIMVAGFSSLMSIGADLLNHTGSRSTSSSDSDSEDNSAEALGFAMVLAGALLYSLGYLLQAWHSRRREFVADEAAVAITGTDALASALAKIEQLGSQRSGKALAEQKPQFAHLYISSHSSKDGFWGFVSSLLSRHPKTQERKRAINRTVEKVELDFNSGLPEPRSTKGL